MPLFCPMCGNILLIEKHDTNPNRFCCPTCPYRSEIKKKHISESKLKKKVEGDVWGGDDAWENVDRTKANCPHCDNDEAFFMQIQIRSADEPMTVFYKCTKCHKHWND